jgi:hypothetical protein
VTRDDIEARLDAVERAITDGSHTLEGVADAASTAARLEELEGAVEDLDERLAEVESGVAALRGYLGGVQAVNDDVEQRANAALAKAEALEAELIDDAHLRRERIDVPRVNDACDARKPGDSCDSTTSGAPRPRRSDDAGDDATPSDGRDRADDEPIGLAARVRDAL